MEFFANVTHALTRSILILLIVFSCCATALGQVQLSVSASLDVPCLVRIVGASQKEVLVNASTVNMVLVLGEAYGLKLRPSFQQAIASGNKRRRSETRQHFTPSSRPPATGVSPLLSMPHRWARMSQLSARSISTSAASITSVTVLIPAPPES